MKAIGYTIPGSIDAPQALVDIDLPMPKAAGHDLLVEVKAIAANPVDTKVRKSSAPTEGEYKVLGYDAVGVVTAVGDQVSLFQVGDEVWYAGDITRSGSNAEYQLVDERIVGHKPKSLSFADAAALPLTGITAWELLFDRLQLPQDGSATDARVLIIGAAGGVGSIITQLASKLTGATVIGTASRAQTADWVKELGADVVINHHQPLSQELAKQQIADVTHVISLTHTDQHFDEIVEILRPQGKIALIDDPKEPLDIMKLKRKSLSLHWELMFTRSMFQTQDMIKQHQLLDTLAELVDAGKIKTTVGEHYGQINAANLIRAHKTSETNTTIGKMVLEGF
ncbi:zinc-binding alcohol dehydrogenase family protein [Shewanella sp. Isolate11]|uniref:zinc-binding alcohol dehydrogenase family protein n=1 Tax=Shewanella sp. Isolate11 TaxID=2908530 RepID=UPI001EFE780A|nr:zinc-binding alcohol dehydrogenase family protein [Shewanella sp. Isolate11]MCG9695441.1 zinc-binding alcohol dehydrogenase family protein [Shewanella sp. Isolate11]